MSTFVDNINVVTIMYEDILLTPLDSSRKEEIALKIYLSPS